MPGITEIVLPEGCTLIAFAQGEAGQGAVLARREAIEPHAEDYATWMIGENREAPGRWDYTFWGHYFNAEEDAWNDWINRVLDPKQLRPLRKAKG